MKKCLKLKVPKVPKVPKVVKSEGGPTDFSQRLYMVAGNEAKSFEILIKELHLPCYLVKHA